LPGARHIARGRHHDAAGCGRPVLGARYHRDDPRRDGVRRGCGLCRAAALVLHERRVGARDHSGRRPGVRTVRPVRPGGRHGVASLSGTASRSMMAAFTGMPFSRRHILRAAIAAPGIWFLRALPAAAQAKPRVVATFSILADFVKNVAEDRLDVDMLVGPENDAHVYAATPADARRVGAAAMV